MRKSWSILIMKSIEWYCDRMWNNGGDANYLSIAEGPYFMQIIGPKKGLELYIDTVSNEHLAEDEMISEDQVQQIKDLGFETAPRSGDFSITLPFGRDNANYLKVEEIVNKLFKIYGMNPKKADVELILE